MAYNYKHNSRQAKKFFDSDWYIKENPELKNLDITSAEHFLTVGWRMGKNPSPDFDMKEYLIKYPEILPINMNPLIHMAYLTKNVPSTDLIFHEDATALEKEFLPLPKTKLKRLIVFASVHYGSIIPDYELHYLEKLKEISDAIIYISDSPVLPKEFEKLEKLVNYACCQRHEKHSFGSYQLGIEYIIENIGLENIEELILCNNSCTAPLFDFNGFFDVMQNKNVDFWAASSVQLPLPHLQSYFMSFNNKVINSSAFLSFFSTIEKEVSKLEILLKYEVLLTRSLEKAGFTCDAYINGFKTEASKAQGFEHEDLTAYPCYLMQRKHPFVRMTFLVNPSSNYDGVKKTLDAMQRHNPSLTSLVKKHLSKYTLHKKNWFRLIPNASILQDLRKKRYIQFKNEILEAMHNEKEKKAQLAFQNFTIKESQTIHKYLDGLNGIEINASRQDPFSLGKTGAYANVAYKADHKKHEYKHKQQAYVNIFAEGDDLPFKDESLDYVLSAHSIENFFDPIKAINEWHRVVKKNKFIVLLVSHKRKTVNKLRKLTQTQELLERHSGKLTHANYALLKPEIKEALKKEQGNSVDLPTKVIVPIENNVIPDDYAPISAQENTLYAHWNVWDTESFIDLCKTMKWNIIETLDLDDKNGNTFLVVLKK